MSKYQVGDRVKVTIVGTVIDNLEGDPEFLVAHEDEGYEYANMIAPHAKHVVSVEKLKHRKPPVGTVISGRLLKDTWWKRGTVIRGGRYPNGNLFQVVLNAKGDWYNVELDSYLTFKQCPDDATFEVAYLP